MANTAELHAAILEDLLGTVDLKPTKAGGDDGGDGGGGGGGGGGDWQDRLVALLESYTTVLFQNPALARSALVARPSGPNYLAIVEAILALLHEGGMPDRQAGLALDILLQVATATAAEQSARHEDESAAEEEFGALMEVLHAADSSAYPRIVAIGDDLFSGTPEERLGWAFHAIINGALATPRVSASTD